MFLGLRSNEYFKLRITAIRPTQVTLAKQELAELNCEACWHAPATGMNVRLWSNSRPVTGSNYVWADRSFALWKKHLGLWWRCQDGW